MLFRLVEGVRRPQERPQRHFLETPDAIMRVAELADRPGAVSTKNKCRMDRRYVSLIKPKRQKGKDSEGREPAILILARSLAEA